MDNDLFDIDKAVQTIDPNVSTIRSIVEEVKGLTITDFGDKEQLEAVKEGRKTLVSMRTKISGAMKGFREGAIKFQKDVIAKEKELIAEILPEEERLKGLEAEAKEKVERKRRMAVLPQRKEQLASIGYEIPKESELYLEDIDEGLLGMDDKTFDNYFTNVNSAKNEHDRKIIEEKEKKIAEDQRKLDEEKAKREAEEKGKREAEEKAQREKEEAKERKKEARVKSLTDLGYVLNQDEQGYVLEGQKIVSFVEVATDTDEEFAVKVERVRVAINKKKEEAEAQAEKERKEAEEKAEKEKLEREEKYKNWLVENGLTEETKEDFVLKRVGNEVTLYKKVSTYNVE